MAAFFQSITTRTAGFETIPQKNFISFIFSDCNLILFSIFALPSQLSFYSVPLDTLMTVIVFLLLFVFYMPHQQLAQMIY